MTCHSQLAAPHAAAKLRLAVRPLTAAGFAPFGEVIEVPEDGGTPANQGTARRFDGIAALDLANEGGQPLLSTFRVRPAVLPFIVSLLERHPLSTQAFVPIGERRFLVVVAPAGGEAPDANAVRAFVTNGRQGVNYKRGIWHHPVLAIDGETDFVVLGRSDDGRDCDIVNFPGGAVLRIDSLPE